MQYFDRCVKDQQTLLPSQAVQAQDYMTGKWTPAAVTEESPEPHS